MKSQEKQLSNSAVKFVRKTSAGVLVWPECSAGAVPDTLKETPIRCASPAKRATAVVT